MSVPSRSSLSGSEILRQDEEALRAGRPSVRVAVFADRGLSIGVSQTDEAPSAKRARARGLPVHRRSSGGSGILYGPGDLAWSLVLPRSHRWVGSAFARNYAPLGDGVRSFLAAMGIQAEWRSALCRSDECCLLGRRGEALAVGTRVVGGAAQHLSGGYLLHHGVLIRAFDPALARDLFDLTTADLDRLTSLTAEVGSGLPDSELLAEDLHRHLERALAAGP
jgi:lipoate-protein ligase A